MVRGEPGIGKTELLRHLTAKVSVFGVARVASVESEMELPFAGLRQLCAPMLGGLGSLADPQRRGLGVTLGLASGDSPDRFVVALAALSLIAETAEEQPMLDFVDDARSLERPPPRSLDTSGAACWRTDSAGARDPDAGPGDPSPNHLAGLPELRLGDWTKSRLGRCWRRSPRVRWTRVSAPGTGGGVHGHPLALPRALPRPERHGLAAGSLFRTPEICPGASNVSTQRA